MPPWLHIEIQAPVDTGAFPLVGICCSADQSIEYRKARKGQDDTARAWHKQHEHPFSISKPHRTRRVTLENDTRSGHKKRARIQKRWSRQTSTDSYMKQAARPQRRMVRHDLFSERREYQCLQQNRKRVTITMYNRPLSPDPRQSFELDTKMQRVG